MAPTLELVPLRSRSRSRDRSLGQVAVIFALSIVLFVALTAVVVDIAFYWVTTLKVQRAADAAALAGAVYLPGDTGTACSEARASATQNGYTPTSQSGCLQPSSTAFTCATSGGVGVCPAQDTDPRQLNVTVTSSSPAFFARVVGITSFPVTRSAKGIYVLPVPMGSPLAYYGVGDFAVNVSTPNPPTPYVATSASPYTSVTPTVWTNPDRGWSTGASNYATSGTNNQVQQWSAWNIPAGSIGATIDGIVVTFHSKVNSGGANCRVKAEVTWNGSAGSPTWGSLPQSTLMPPGLTFADAAYTLGSPTVAGTWDGSHSWAKADFTNTNFRVRLTYVKGTGCGTVSVNNLAVKVYSHTDNAPTINTQTTLGVYDGATLLASEGGWGAIITQGGSQGNGDAYAPATAVRYDPLGYNYAISLPSGGLVKVFDPGFCAMGPNTASGSLGAGDHWIGTAGTPVSTYYTLWNSNGKLGLPGSWTEVYTSGTMFEDQKGYDPANMGPGGTGSAPGGATNTCDANHNAWWTMPTGALGTGAYVLQVQTTKTAHVGVAEDTSKNNGTNAENMWSIEAVGSGTPQVYGNGRMTVYNNLQATNTPQQFYLAKIDQSTGAGKTALIDLFDPGDLSPASGSKLGFDGTLQVFSPDGGTSHAVTFSYTSDNYVFQTGNSPGNGTSVSQIKTTTDGLQSFNNSWIHISIPMSSAYGSGGLWMGGWWQIVYTTPKGGNDTTTWEVSVSGNPVHLLVP